jgi:flagellar hook assembly protein FlgD
VRGDEICALVNEKKEAGYHQLLWNGKDASGHEAPTGIYLITIEAGEFNASRKMIKIK